MMRTLPGPPSGSGSASTRSRPGSPWTCSSDGRLNEIDAGSRSATGRSPIASPTYGTRLRAHSQTPSELAHLDDVREGQGRPERAGVLRIQDAAGVHQPG